MNIYIIIGIIIFIGLVAFISWNVKQNSNLNPEKKQSNRALKLVVLSDFAQISNTISEKATTELIDSTMKSIDWEKFHAVYLEDKNGNSVDVSGSLYDDGLSSSFTNDDVQLLKVNPPETVEEMTEILLTFLKGEEIWQSKYKYE